MCYGLDVNLPLIQIRFFLAYLPYLEKGKYAYEITMLSVCLCIPHPRQLLNA
jgi:hypothetical protein